MAIVQTGLTLDEFLKLPEEKPHLEYLDGVVTQKMAAKGPHGTLQFVLAKWLDRAGGEGESAWVVTQTHTHWAHRASLVPDISVYLIDRVPTTPEGLIATQRDRFDFWAWSRQALGRAGLLLGWTPMLKNKVRAGAAKNLAAYMARTP